MDAASETGATILQLKISLVGASKPPVWRRVLVRADIRLDRLHAVIQAAMGWQDCHMHVFANGSAEFGLPDTELGHRDERRTMLTELLTRPGDRLRYTYDFGDGWEHDILVEEVPTAEPDAPYPICLTGKGACPPEDCGGVWGYEHLREVLAD
ncbi:MAG: plasmid pRiA4b ORF-3 family protein, partial [Chloroflexota bacterium]|nr:plasmid pRiA4b ORF-3 family protein [Chloroflexota bacterium]